ncbi:MAG: copper chaperone PCu(A)C [Dermatophilaceae bacterium]
MSTPARGATRVGRSVVLGGTGMLLAMAAHLHGGGTLPAPVALAVLVALAALGAGTLTSSRLGAGGVLATLALAQLVSHCRFARSLSAPFQPMTAHTVGRHAGQQIQAVSLTTTVRAAMGRMSGMPGMTSGHDGAVMLWAHVVATALTALVVLYGEAALWSLWEALAPRLVPGAPPVLGSVPCLRVAPVGALVVAIPTNSVPVAEPAAHRSSLSPHPPRAEARLSRVPGRSSTQRRKYLNATPYDAPRPGGRRSSAALALTAGCGSSATPSSTSTSPSVTTTTGADEKSRRRERGRGPRCGQVKATEGEMTGVFGIIHNHAATDVTVTSATSPLTKRVELHEVVMVDGAMKIWPKAGGFMLPAKGSHELTPGHDHIMLMGLSAPLKTGTTVEVTLHMSDGTTVTFTAPVRPATAKASRTGPARRCQGCDLAPPCLNTSPRPPADSPRRSVLGYGAALVGGAGFGAVGQAADRGWGRR